MGVQVSTNDARHISGERPQFDRMFGGSVANYYKVTATATVLSGACIVYGVRCRGGTAPTIALRDATTGSGDIRLNVSGTADTFYGIGSGGMGIIFPAGLHATLGGTSPDFDIYAVATGG